MGPLFRLIAGVSVLVLPLPADAAGREPPDSNVLIAGFVGAQHAYGSGVIVGANGAHVTIVTAEHNRIIERAQYLTTGGESLEIESIEAVPGGEQALVTARRPRRRFSVAISAPAPPAGTAVTVWGPIDRLPFTEHGGATRELDSRLHDAPPDALAIDCAACDHGDSGAGVYDAAGRLVGIITRGYYDNGRKLLVLVERLAPALVARAGLGATASQTLR